MTTKETTEAERYARLIAEEVAALDDLLGGETEPDTIRAAIYAAIGEPADGDRLDELTADPETVAYIWLNEIVLDLRVLRDHRDDTARLELLRTSGGPRCEITRDTSDGTAVEVVAWNGSEHYAHRMNPTAFAAWLDDLAGVVGR